MATGFYSDLQIFNGRYSPFPAFAEFHGPHPSIIFLSVRTSLNGSVIAKTPFIQVGFDLAGAAHTSVGRMALLAPGQKTSSSSSSSSSS